MYDAPKLTWRFWKWGKENCIRKSVLTEKKGYSEFREKYLGINGKEYFPQNLHEIQNRYDTVVVGSDQVWNVCMVDFDEAFFLGWTKATKVAYAPSLGGKELSQSANFNQIKAWLREFSSISVREENGKRCLEQVTGRNVPKVLDPTLTIEEDFWYNVVNKPLIDGDYIFYYSWAYREESTSRIVAEESKRTGMPVYVIDPRKWTTKDPSTWGFHLFEQSGPYIFLNLMKYAKKCYVESFHGIVFAYIFRKNFWVLDTSDNIASLDSRMLEFIKLLGAEGRVLTPYNVMYVNQDSLMEYGENKLLQLMRLQSKQYLEEALDTFK